MAFNVKGWSRGPRMGSVGSGPGSTKYKHFYVTPDDGAAVIGGGYFNSIAAQLSQGDIFECALAVTTAPVTKTFIVTSATGAVPVVIALQAAT